MSFVKLDTRILNSSLWLDREAREVFLTALLLASPRELTEPAPEIATRSLALTGWSVPPGWYGFVEAANVGLIRWAGVEKEEGMAALERLAAPDPESRTPDHDGRRLVRVDGGFVVLNYIRYRDKDHTAKERMRRYRARHGASRTERDVTRNGGVSLRHITHADADADADQDLSRRGNLDQVARAREAPAVPAIPSIDPTEVHARWAERWRRHYGERQPGGQHFDPRRTPAHDLWLQVALLADRESAATGETASAILDRALDALYADRWHRDHGHLPAALVSQWAQLLTPRTEGFLAPSEGPLGYSSDDIPPAPPTRRRRTA